MFQAPGVNRGGCIITYEGRSQLSAEQHGQGRPGLRIALWRGLRGFCPACGKEKLFVAYLKQIDQCAACHEPFGHVRSDDAAPWLSILVVGHITLPIILLVERHTLWPLWATMTVWPVFTLGLTLAILPRAKGLLLSIIWATGAPGSERE